MSPAKRIYPSKANHTDECDRCGALTTHIVDCGQPLTAIPVAPGWVYWLGDFLCPPCYEFAREHRTA